VATIDRRGAAVGHCYNICSKLAWCTVAVGKGRAFCSMMIAFRLKRDIHHLHDLNVEFGWEAGAWRGGKGHNDLYLQELTLIFRLVSSVAHKGDDWKNQRRQRTTSLSTPAPTMPRGLSSSAFMKPFVVLALPGMYLFYKYNQYRRQQQEQNRRKVTERELAHLNHKIVSYSPLFFCLVITIYSLIELNKSLLHSVKTHSILFPYLLYTWRYHLG